jgi:beta-glucosidase
VQNLTLWHGGDDLIHLTASQCANTIVVLHTVGPVLVEPWYNHPNVTAILYAGLPGQESGNSLLDVLIGTVNPWVSFLN